MHVCCFINSEIIHELYSLSVPLVKGDEWFLLVTITFDFEKFIVKNSKIIEIARHEEPNIFNC